MSRVLTKPDATESAQVQLDQPLWQRVIVAAPDAVLVPLTWLCVVVSTTILFRAYTPWLVVPVVVVLSVLTWRWRPTRYVARFGWQSSALAMLGIVAWVGVNAPFASRWVQVSRDPGFLTLEGIWLSHHSNPNPPVAAAAAIAAKIPGATLNTGAYFVANGVWHVQGAKLVPGLAAIGGWIGGTDGVLVANIFIGALALIGVYSFARRLAGPVWSLPATAGLAISIPFVAFTRSIYSEPITVALTFGALTLLWCGYRSRRWGQLLAGGIMLGAGGLARIDGTVIVIGLIAGLALVAFFATTRARRSQLRAALLLAGTAALAVTALGLVELKADSPEYMAALTSEWRPLVVVAVALLVVGAALAFGPSWRWITDFAARRRRALGGVACGITVAVSAGMASRPLWYVAHNLVPGTPTSGLEVSLAHVEGLPADPTRSWDEQSLNWVASYISWIVVAAALIGLAFALRHAIISRDPGLLLAVTVVAAPSLLYLWDIAITPDQIWAMRRFLPVTLPGFLVFAAWLFRAIVMRLVDRRNAPRVVAAVAASAIGVAGFAFPAVTWLHSNLFTAVEMGGQLGQDEGLCNAIGNRPVIAVGSSAPELSPTLLTLCGSQVILHTDPMTAATQSAALAAFGSEKPVIITNDPNAVVWSDRTAPPPYSRAVITSWQLTLNERPTAAVQGLSTFWAGTIGADGTLSPIAPGATQ